MSAAQQVQMQVVHSLPAIVACVHDDPVAIVQLLFACDLSRRGHQMAHQRRIFSQRLRRRANVLFGNDQQMRGRLRIDVGKADAEFVFVHAVGRNGAVDNLAEQTVGRCRSTRL